MEKYNKTRSRFLEKNQHFFRQITVFTKEVTKELISRNFLSMIAFYSTFPHCAKEITKELISRNFYLRDRVLYYFSMHTVSNKDFFFDDFFEKSTNLINYRNKLITLLRKLCRAHIVRS